MKGEFPREGVDVILRIPTEKGIALGRELGERASGMLSSVGRRTKR